MRIARWVPQARAGATISRQAGGWLADEREDSMWAKPIVEIRVEEFTRGTLPRYLELHRTLATPLLLENLGLPIAYYVTNVGRINCVTQLWGYGSVAEYEARRDAAESDPQWRQYMRESDGIVRFASTRLTRRIVFPKFPGLDDGAAISRGKPIVDFRVYRIHHSHMGTFVQTSEEHAMKVMLRHIGPPLGYYQTIVGDLNEITHIWGFDSMGDMEARRAARNADPEWPAYLDASDGIYNRQETQILRRLKLFPGE